MNELIGRTLAKRYHVQAFLGKGGMAEVYKVWDQVRSVPLAMKILHADMAEDKIFLRRFKREAQTLAKLQHPNIVRFYGLEQADGLVFILMEFVEGTTLRKEIYETDVPFQKQRTMEVIRPICAALHYAHQSGFVHCDVKPANIMLHTNGTVFVSDFGIARMSESATMTMVGAGTPAYMAPEQVRGDTPSPQMDVYSLGVILYEMSTGGERPFTGENSRTTGSTSEKIRWEQTHIEPPAPRIYSPDISPGLEQLILRSLSKDPNDRPANTQVVIVDLERALAESPISRVAPPIPPSPIPPEPKAPPQEVPRKPAPVPVPARPAPDRGNSLTNFLKSIPIAGWAGAGVLILGLALIALVSTFAPMEADGGLYYYSDRNGKTQIFHLDHTGEVRQITFLGNNYSPISANMGIFFTSDRTGKKEIFYMDDQGSVRQVTHTPGAAESYHPMPYGGGVFFVSNRSGKDEIYYVNGKGIVSGITHTPGSAISHSPAPTVSGLYFTSNRSGKNEIFFMEYEGKIQQLTSTKSAINNQMAGPAINGFYFVSDRDGENLEIFHMDGKGVVEQVTHSSKNILNLNPFETTSGLYFVSNRTGTFEVYHLDHDGIVRQVTKSSSNNLIGPPPN